MQKIPPVSTILERMGIAHRVFSHAGRVESIEQAAAERGQAPNQVIRSILFRLAEDNFIMVLMAGPDQVSWARLRSYLGVSRISMASEEEVLRVTGYRIGSVSPFGVRVPIRMIADQSVFIPEEISLGSGERGIAIIMKSTDLRTALGEIEVTTLTEEKHASK